jgi:AAA+ ATPase superfamily predicted ATPase
MTEQIFIIGGEVEPPYFIGRDEEINLFKLDLLAPSQNNVIIGPRRIGKTSLLRNIGNNVQDKVIFAYINCRNITNPADFSLIIDSSLNF